jgi:Cell division protein SepF
MTVIRSFSDVKATIGMLNAGKPVLLVLRTTESDRSRVLDVLAGWSLGSGGEVDEVSSNTLVATPPGIGPVRLGRTGLVSAVDEAFHDGPVPMSRQREEYLVALATAGDAQARRQLVDTYAELMTLLALRLRPGNMAESMAVLAAQQELERVVGTPFARQPLLASLIEGLLSRLTA